MVDVKRTLGITGGLGMERHNVRGTTEVRASSGLSESWIFHPRMRAACQ